MQVLHITPKTNGYEEVTLIANKIDKTNRLALIKNKDGQRLMSGGLLFEDTPEIRTLLDSIPKEKQYKLLLSIKQEPFVKEYATEEDLK